MAAKYPASGGSLPSSSGKSRKAAAGAPAGLTGGSGGVRDVAGIGT